VAGQPDFVKVLDFGVARVIGQPPLTRVGEEIIGTPEFIAPEMMSASGELSPSVDLYALGIMLHDTVVGEPPWRGDHQRDPARAHECGARRDCRSGGAMLRFRASWMS
jgi:serine/threonine protein kinase